jgi:hypothetical protein
VSFRAEDIRLSTPSNQRLLRETRDADDNLRLALTSRVQIIGEAARRVSSEFTPLHPELAWAEIVGMPRRESVCGYVTAPTYQEHDSPSFLCADFSPHTTRVVDDRLLILTEIAVYNDGVDERAPP